MADSRRNFIYVSARDTGFPGSPPPTPYDGRADRSGEYLTDIAFGNTAAMPENATENAIGGSDNPMRLVGGPREDAKTCSDPGEVTSPERGVTHALGARSKARDSHACQQASDMAATAGHNSAHSEGRGKLVDVTSTGDALAKESRQLKKEISRLQREITQLSARRSRSIRADIRDMLSDTSRSSDVSNVQQTTYAPSHTSPPGTANTEGVWK